MYVMAPVLWLAKPRRVRKPRWDQQDVLQGRGKEASWEWEKWSLGRRRGCRIETKSSWRWLSGREPRVGCEID